MSAIWQAPYLFYFIGILTFFIFFYFLLILPVHYGISHWILPFHNILAPLQENYRTGLKTGDVESAAFSIHSYLLAALTTGKPLGSVEADMRKFGEQMKDHKQILSYKPLMASLQYVLNLMGRAENPRLLSGEVWPGDGADDTQHLDMKTLTRQCWLLHYFGDYEKAWDFAMKTPDLKKVVLGAYIIWRHAFHVGLVAYAMAKKTGKSTWKKRASMYHKQIRKWYNAGNVNCHHMLKLFDAERAVANGKKHDDCKKAYDEAIATSGRYGLRHDSALANQLAGEYFLHRHDPDEYWAGHYLRQAIRLYEEWEAKALVDYLNEKYVDLLTKE